MQANQTIDKSNLTTVMKRGGIGGQQRVFFFFLHTSESEYESTFTILGKDDVFCPCCNSELPRNKERHHSAYTWISKRLYIAILQVFLLFFIQICHQHGVYIRDHFSAVLTTKEKN
ncbi:hypothetical protein M441DRAFT_366229 [Trichoderma asperellum CBS 433.97]|uniref:Uncharacterized protein n=1 Tax=Trichoderma asperellum (strain ATCC 204424 / CBS 433.97 / NBRC 101777) TaxID=1042311 RepID=A0A2T3ZE99_TRIA4|nr:hypothetical protein M441DRAFT_366229 [Trichoderma asperellum CBS 433.97]PTB43125.1 hypothetical protein M441DRAFT_366229 [Trichoderma asperellum CBS 433.97]